MGAATGRVRTEAALSVRGQALEVAWWGATTPLTLVLLHEGLGSVGLWRDFPERLAERTGLSVFAWSRLGYGQSDTALVPRPLDYMEIEAAEFVGPMLDVAAIGRCVLIGHSDGATIAALYAGGRQDRRVRGLVLIAPHYFVEDVAVAEIARARMAYEQGDLRARLARHHRDVDSAFLGWNGAWLDPGFPAVLNLHSHVAHIRVPILQIQGADDMYGTLAQPRFAEAAAYCPVETLVVENARHAPHIEAPDLTMNAIADFLTRLAAHENMHNNAV